MSTKHQIWITYNNETEKILIPVNPTKLQASNGSNNEKASVIDIGDVTIKQAPPAEIYQWSSFFPATYFQGCVSSNIPVPQDAVSKIKRWKNGDKPVHFIVTGLGINGYYTIEQFDPYHVGGDVGTIYYNIKLMEYRSVTIRQIATMQVNRATRIDNTVPASTYTVVKGDCLWNLAKKFYGKSAQFTKIYNANSETIESAAKSHGKSSSNNGHWIYPGTVLTIPAA